MNLLGFAPVIVMLVMISVGLPVFVTVVAIVLALLNFTLPKPRMFGTSLTAPAEMVIVALADFVVSSGDVAVRVTVGPAGTFDGAV